MASSSWNFTVPATSPMYSYFPYTSVTSSGWKTYCTTTDTRCDDNTAHVTGAHSHVSLSFNGTGIALYGNATQSMTITAQLEDGTPATQGMDASSQLLASFSGLEPTVHTVTLTAVPASKDDLLYFTQSVVTYDTGVPNAPVNSIYFDDLSPSFLYGDNWNVYTGDDGTVAPSGSGISSTTYHATNILNTNATLRFKGAAVFLYGPCDAQSGDYEVLLSPGNVSLTLMTTTPQADIGSSAVESCLRFFATGLDNTVEREMSVQLVTPGMFATIDYVQVVDFDVPSASKPPIAAIAGGAAGGAVLLALFALLTFFLCRRRRSLSRPSYTSTPFYPPRPPFSRDDTEKRPGLPTSQSSKSSMLLATPLPAADFEWTPATPGTPTSAQTGSASSTTMLLGGGRPLSAHSPLALAMPELPYRDAPHPHSQMSNSGDMNRMMYQLGRLARPGSGSPDEDEEGQFSGNHNHARMPSYTDSSRDDRSER